MIDCDPTDRQGLEAPLDPAGAEAVPERITPEELAQVLSLLRADANLDFRCYRRPMLVRRIERRMNLFGGQSADYLAFLREHSEEVKQLSRDLLISVTSFFRDPAAWHALQARVIGPLVRSKQPGEPLRIWDIGCATGEEAYSLAILVLERLAAAQQSRPVRIFATDVDEAALETARRGAYPASIASEVSAERLGRFFTPIGGGYQVSNKLRESVVFARQNVITDAPFSKLDLIVCRNLLIYLETDMQNRIIPLLHYALKEGGALFLGSSETIGRHTALFEPIWNKWRIYRRIDSARAELLPFPVMPPESRRTWPCAAGKGLPDSTAELQSSQEELHTLNLELRSVSAELSAKTRELETARNDLANILNGAGIAVVFLDGSLCVRRFTPAATRFFRLVGGDVGRPLDDIAMRFRDDALLDHARKCLTDRVSREQEVRTNDGRACVRRVIPCRLPDGRVDGILLAFAELATRETPSRK